MYFRSADFSYGSLAIDSIKRSISNKNWIRSWFLRFWRSNLCLIHSSKFQCLVVEMYQSQDQGWIKVDKYARIERDNSILFPMIFINIFLSYLFHIISLNLFSPYNYDEETVKFNFLSLFSIVIKKEKYFDETNCFQVCPNKRIW